MTEPANLQDYILAEVTRKTSEEHIRKLIDKKIDEAIQSAVDDEFRYGGNVKKQLTTAVGAALSIGDKIDVPAYGVMVMALLREKLDANITELLNVKLASEMQELLQIAPKELKFSAVLEKMIEQAKEGSDTPWGKIAVFIEESDSSYLAGCYHVGIDPDGDTRKRYECETQFYVDNKGKVSGLSINRRDVAKVIGMGSYWGYQKMVFSAYACGSMLIMDELDPSLEYGEY
ncbi:MULTISPECIES: hypothetical protein [Agrobacterium tumefaciens complex]|uniref:Gp42 n=1 Tax=Agrobacterium tomkonis CFBP 6623 TaxID=1183432 RepID=A0A1S7PE37_9HYPH|nr:MULTISPECIES: hypothetical protein [Agrobacterium tumefaciens complex]QCL88772.1 hypothetical protein CFBP6623_06235 [Agrobacterium tumefaciens]CUX19832.1 Gp42 [Agrobacterium tomkonis CFBP 6623]